MASKRSSLLPLLALYALSLVASHVWRATHPLQHGVRPGMRVADVDGVRIAYDDLGQPAPGTLPVLLLHGSPGAASNFSALGTELARSRRSIAPDLPGFGASSRSVPDYSVRSHAEAVLGLLDQLGIERAHVVGFSMGGGVGLELDGLASERVASLTLLSAIGVQELELFGDYHLNHGVHALQLAFLWSLAELVPHFGALDGGMLSIAYARNFYDTDQRPLRERLQAFEAPMLVLHGRDDVLVPFAAAVEHHRLVPQSELAAFDANHFLLFRRSGELVRPLEEFFSAVEEGRARSRADATPERVAAAREPFDPSAVPPLSGFSLAVFTLLAAVATFVSEDLTCIGVGALVGQGRVGFVPGTFACLLGIWVGDVLLFLAGRLLGRRALGRWPLRVFLSSERVATSSAWFEEKGPAVIFLSRFLPGSRLPTYFAAGALHTSFWRFNLWFLLAALLWTPILVWLSGALAGTLGERLELLQENLLFGLFATLAIGYLFVKLVRPLGSRRGRRLLVGAWRRKARWEYWPRWVFYPPVALACVFHALRRRSALAFTAANPCIPHGGLVGESKAAILRGLAQGELARGRLARTLVVPGGPDTDKRERHRRVGAFRARLEPGAPVVVKPDVGQRGDGVRVVRTVEELDAALDALPGAALVQEFVSGPEFGVFYARGPDEARGRLLSVARKVLPAVSGDGYSTLEALILDDPRAVVHAEDFLARHTERLHEVPAAGERVALGELGTHCRGAAFLEGEDLATPALELAIEETARGLEGFSFGRFDLRAPSEEAFRAGEFRVLELNGVSSECAHVYDPRYSVLDGWRAIIAQWRIAFDIGLAQARRGAHVSSLRELLATLRGYRRGDHERVAVDYEEIP